MPQLNQLAPDFTLSNQAGESRTLSAFRGQPVVLYFYPKDDTPGCTVQACNYRDAMGELTSRGIKVFGISKDDVKSHAKFVAKFNLNFEILADPDKTVLAAYDVLREGSMYGKPVTKVARTTFVIDKNGVLIARLDDVNPETDVQNVLAVLG
jgi:thioredoxin-dependent peroxiredoxin